MSILYVELDTRRTFTRTPDGNDSWDIGDTTTEIEYLGLRSFDWSYDNRTTRSRINTQDDIKTGDTVAVVVLRYTTGCTFGTQTWNAEVLDAFLNPKDAVGLCDALVKAHKKGEYTVTYNGKEYYAGAWTGYFESINDIEIREVIVQ